MSNSNRSYFREQQLCKIEGERPAIQSAADERGLTLTVRNDGQHWDFRRKGCLIDWWPGSGKVAVDKDFGKRLRADSAAEIIVLLVANKGPVAVTPVAAAPRLPRMPQQPSDEVASIMACFDFDRALAAMTRVGWRYGYASTDRPVTMHALRACAADILTGCGRKVGDFITSGGLLAMVNAEGVLELRPAGRLAKLLEAPPCAR